VSFNQCLSKQTILQYYDKFSPVRFLLCLFCEWLGSLDGHKAGCLSLSILYNVATGWPISTDERGLKYPPVSGVAPHDSLRAGRDKRRHVSVDGVIGGELTLPFAGNC
jgi:hypothetical protein